MIQIPPHYYMFGEPDSKIWISKLEKENPVTGVKTRQISDVPHTRIVSQISISYRLKVLGTCSSTPPNDMEDTLDCVVVTYAPPEGKTSLITKQAEVKRWVYNVECSFTAILSR